ncbi:MAG TPA: MoxR family ATPase [Pirellulales bacterium]|nr:MoxR family ATPase [Pirellulales bacterium]
MFDAATDPDLAGLAKLKDAHRKLRDEIARVVVGQDQVIDQLMIAIFARGHCMLEGVPGLAKTLMVSTLANCLSLDFNRIQFTPDLMPSDITGTEVLQEDRSTGARQLRYVHGPIFANVVLADEINRTPPKTQAALLEAMQERQVSAGGQRYPLPEPFFVLATQNPIEQEGTYPLPEAQLDRFLFKVYVGYPTPDEERQIYRLTTGMESAEVSKVLSGSEIPELQVLVRRVPVSDHCLDFAMNLVRATRAADEMAPKYVPKWIAWGAGPRAGQSLILASKARAALDGRTSVTIEDLRALAAPVLRHRLVTTYSAQAEGETPDSIIRRLLDDVPERPGIARTDGQLAQVLRS